MRTPHGNGTAGTPAERRSSRRLRLDKCGETTQFDLSALDLATHRKDDGEPLLVVISGLQKGRPIPVREGRWTLGRGSSCDVSMPGRGISRIHLHVERLPDGEVVVTDAGSTNGLRVNGPEVARHSLRPGDLIALGPETVLEFDTAPKRELELRLRQYEQSTIDDLTGAHNRRYLMACLEHEVAFALRHEQPLCLMLLDIDHFKQVNDTHGHQGGDLVIRGLAARISDRLRTEDIFARLGGDEFAVLTRGMSAAAATEVAERVRAEATGAAFQCDGIAVSPTVSIGAAMLRQNYGTDVNLLMNRADENLYLAKQQGRDRVVLD